MQVNCHTYLPGFGSGSLLYFDRHRDQAASITGSRWNVSIFVCRGNPGISVCGSRRYADGGGSPDVPNHLLWLRGFAARKHLPPANSMWVLNIVVHFINLKLNCFIWGEKIHAPKNVQQNTVVWKSIHTHFTPIFDTLKPQIWSVKKGIYFKSYCSQIK